MKPYYNTPEGQLYHGHVLEVLKSMPDESVQMCVTSPPYWGLRSYGTPDQIWDEVGNNGSPNDGYCEHVWGDEKIVKAEGLAGSGVGKIHIGEKYNPRDEGLILKYNASQGQFCQKCNAWRGSLGLEPTPELFIKHMVKIFREVKRVLRDDGTIWVNMGDSYAGSGKGQMGNGEHAAKHGEKQHTSQGTTFGGLPTKYDGFKPKDLCGIPWMLAFALRADGWYLRSDIIWHKPNPMPESCKDRPTKSHEYLFLLSKSQKYFYDADAIREKPDKNYGEKPLEYEGKKFNWTKQVGHFGANTKWSNPSGRNKRTVWTIPTQPMPEAHFATFPKKLIEPCILAGTSEKGCCVECGSPWERVVEKSIGGIKGDWHEKSGTDGFVNQKPSGQKAWDSYEPSKTIGWQPTCKCDADTVPCTVLDIFMGSGTSAIVAHRHDRKFVGIELSQTYLDDIAIPRIDRVTKQLKLF